MFSELVESVGGPNIKTKTWALVVSAMLQSTVMLILIMVPLIYTQALPKAILNTALVALPGASSQPAVQAPPVKAGVHAPRLLDHGILIQPPRIPTRVTVFDERPLPPEGPVSEGPITAAPGLDLLSAAPAPVDRVSRLATPPSAPQRVLMPSTIEAAKLISRIQPVYPPLALQARIQGNVVLHAIISKEGGVSELQVLSGHPLLVNAALDAVRQWRYRPTLLNGQAVEVETTITVSFVLGQ